MKANTKNRSTRWVLVVFILLFFATGCAEKEPIELCLEGQQYGFWYGLLHGFIAPIGLISMLFDEHITMYAYNNNGFWYALGFLIGSGGWGILGGKQLSSRKEQN